MKEDQTNIQLLDSVSGEWKVLIVDGAIYYEGHEIPDDVYLTLFKDLNCKTSTKEISDDAMERRTFEKKLKKFKKEVDN